MIRALRWAAVVLLLAAAGTAVWMRLVGDDPAIWHVDPAAAARTGKPNDYLVAPAGLTTAAPDRIARVHATDAETLLFQFDALARRSRSADVVAGSVAAGHITYVQRSRIFGFPDYISVRAVPVDGGSALIIWSRSRYGRGDMGVNRARVEEWLGQLGE